MSSFVKSWSHAKVKQSRSARSNPAVRLFTILTFALVSSLLTVSNAMAATPQAVSVGDMLAPGGVDIGLGVTATAQIITTGTGAAGLETPGLHGQTGTNPIFLGGNLTTPPDVGFDEANFPLGSALDATRAISQNRSTLDNGLATGYADSIGFKITFSSPIPVSYFYAVDLDGSEWKTAFAFDNAGNFVSPTISFQLPNNQLTLRTNATINEAGWETDIPGLNVPAQINLVARTGGGTGIGPNSLANQAIFNFNEQSVKEVYFVYGVEQLANTTGDQNSGISGIFLPDPQIELTKSATIGSLLPDGTFNVTYQLLVENTGSATFDSVSLPDNLGAASNLGTAFNGVSPAGVVIAPVINAGGSDFPAANPNFDGNGSSGDAEIINQTDTVSFEPGDSFTATFTVNIDPNATSAPASLDNSASVEVTPAGFAGLSLIETSDNDDTADGTSGADANPGDGDSANENATVVTPPEPKPSLSITKVADVDANVVSGQTITYTYEVTNNGDVNIADVTIADMHTSAAGTAPLSVANEGLDADSAPTGDSTDTTANDGSWDLLGVNDTLTFTSTYVVTAADISAGDPITNTATANGTPPGGTLAPPSATESVELANAIVAVDNILVVPIDTTTSQIGVVSVLGNDTLDGVAIDPADVTVALAPGATLPPGFTLNADGSVDVAANTPSGIYSFDYEVCEAGVTPPNCAIATVTIPVAGAIGAIPEVYPPVNSAVGATLPTILGTDTLNGSIVNPADIALTVDTVLGPDGNPTTAITVNPDGTVDVPAGTPAGTYEIEYTICEIADPDNCSTAKETIVVEPPSIAAIPETFPPVSGADGGSLTSILASDTLNGDVVDPADIDLTVDSILGPDGNPSTAITVNPDGTIDVAPGTQAGDYKVEYTICEKINPTNCSTTVETITVAAPGINAIPETYPPVSSADGGSLPSLLGSDTLNGAIVDAADINLVIDAILGPDGNPTAALTVNPDGTIDVPAGTPPGDYKVEYTICEITNPTNCSTTIETITVAASVIAAIPETYPPVSGANGGSLPSLLSSDTLNGAIVDPAEIVLTIDAILGPDGNPSTAITVNPDGTIDVPPGTPGGDYKVEYTICEKDVPTNCSTTIETITVTAPAPQIGVIKSATNIGAFKSDGTFDVTYTILVENTGNATLTPLTLTDDLSDAAQLGSAFNGLIIAPAVSLITNVSGNSVAPTTNGAAFTGTASGPALIIGTDGLLEPGDAYTVTFTANLNPAAPGAPAVLANVATAGGTPPTGAPISDDSNSGTDPDGTPTGENPIDNPGGPGDPTIVTPPPLTGQIGAVKGVVGISNLLPDGSFDVTYLVVASNTGTTPLTALRLTDLLDDPANLGSAFNSVTVAPVVTLTNNTSGNAVAPTSTGVGFTGRPGGSDLLTGTTSRLDPGDEFSVEFTANLNPNAAGAPAILNNQATVSGTILGTDTVVSDTTNATTDIAGDPTGELPITNPGGPGSPTPVAPPAADARIGVAKSVSVAGVLADGTFDATFTLLVENLGNVELSQLTLIDELSAPSNLGTAFVGLRTAPTLQLINTSGNSIAPSLNSGFTGNAGGASILTGTDGLLQPGDQFEVVLVATIDPNAPNAPTELTNQATAGGTSPDGQTPEDLSDDGSEASGPNLEGGDNDPTPIAVPETTPLITTKETSTPFVSAGGFASYTVSITNPGAFQVNAVTLVDDLPGGFAYVEDSAQLLRAGSATPASVSGIDPITTIIGSLDAGETVSVSYLTRVGAGVVTGEHINSATAQVFGQDASNTAQATVTLGEDPLLTTTRVIGKVWHDRDSDGWQDGAWATGMRLVGGPFGKGKKLEDLAPRASDSDIDSAPMQRVTVPGTWRDLDVIELRTAQGTVLRVNNSGAVTEHHRGQKKRNRTAQNLSVNLVRGRDSRIGASRDTYLEIRNEGVSEEGLPGVRLATIEGLLIETDRWGRYHIEEIENVSWDIGSNYIVKVDPQTLPTGSEFTTENPRVERLTQSLMSNIDFGVRIPKREWQAVGCPNPQQTAAATPAAQPSGGVTIRTEPLTTIRFESGESVIEASEIEAIKQGLERLRGQQNLRLRFTGHTDTDALSASTRARYGDNQGLSEARAERVSQQVISTLGLTEQEIVLVGFGDRLPVADNSTEAGKALNRRVTVEATFEIPDALPEPVTPAPVAVAANENCGPAAPLSAPSSTGVVWQEEQITETLTDKVSEIRFESGKSNIPDDALDNLKRRMDELADKQNLRLRFIGHTDNERLSARTASIYGSNQGLSEARAQQVAERVQQSLQLSTSMIEIEGRGDAQPLADNSTPEGMALNRRVEIVLVYDETRTTPSNTIVERTVPVDQFAATSKPTHGVVRAIEDRAQIDPRLSVIAQSDYLSPVTRSVRFYRYSNYPAFVDRFEINIYRVSDIDRINPVATLTQQPESNLDVEGQMVWTPEGLRAGEEYVYVLSALDRTGARDTTHPRTLSVLRTDKINTTDPEVEPHSIYGETALAQQNIPLSGGRIRVWGHDLAPAHTLTVGNEQMALDERGSFVLEAHLPQGRYTLPVVNKNPAGPAMQQDLNVEISDSYLFMVGLANVTFGGNDLNSVVEPLAADDRFGGNTFTSGQIGFYLKGKIRGKYLITAQLDSTEDELSDLGDNLQRQDPSSVFRRLEADQYYPVYGDDSTTFKDTESQGAGYVRVDWDKSKALWGNFETGITGNEFAQYNRSLYGAQLVYKTNAVTENGDNRISVTGFASEANSMAAHNEFAATGGSLYYLRDTDIVRGSEKLWVEVRRRDTLVVIEQIPLQPGVDYEFDHIQGRIILNRPLSQVTRNRNAAIIRSESIEGDRVFLVANYEFVPSGFDNDSITAGVRGHYWVNSALGLGGTYINESRSGSDYTLAGGDVTFRHGKGTYLKLEGATSETSQTVSQFSTDGGLTFNSVQGLVGAATEGDAYGVEARVNLRDISNRDGVLKAWYKNREEGFSSSRETIQTTDTTDIGFEADVQINDRIKVIARGNEVELDDQARDRVLSLQGEARVTSRLDVAVEVRDEQRDIEVPAAGGSTTVNSDATLFGARINYAIDPDSSVYVEGQVSTGESDAFESNDRIAVGAKTRLTDRWGVGVEVSEGDRGSAILGSVDYRVSDDLAIDIGAGFGDAAYGSAGATINLDNGYQLYGSYGIDPDSTIDRQRNVTTIGQRLVLGNGAKIFNEHQWRKSDTEDGVINVFGIEYALNDYTSVSATLQRGELDFAGVETNRDAASIGVSIQRDDLRLGSRVEWRRDENGVNEFEQWLTSNALEWKQSESTRWLAKINFSRTDDNITGDDAARLAEASLGFAYRPIWTDRWNILGRYTYLDDLVAPEQVINRPDQRSHVASIETLYKLNQRWEFGAKLAIRRGEIRLNRDSGPWFDSGLDIAVGRVRYHFAHKWDGLLEYRYVSNSELNDERSGALIGAYRHLGKNLKFGAGYNFTDYSDDLTNLDYNNGGWFVDLIGKF